MSAAEDLEMRRLYREAGYEHEWLYGLPIPEEVRESVRARFFENWPQVRRLKE